MDFEFLIFDLADGIATITLNRPDAANGMHLAMMREMHMAAIRCDQDAAIRAVIITGAGKMFSAGGDLKSFLAAGDDLGSLLPQMTAHFHGAISLFNRMAAPVICAVNGMAAGGGFSFAIQGDIVIAAQSARFTSAYTNAALSPDGSSTWFLPRLVGLRRAKELMLTNRVLSAEEALDWGLIDRIVPDDELIGEAGALAARFASGPTGAYGAVKQMLAGSFAEGLESQMEIEARQITALAQAPDGREGVRAFAEKRKPDFTGR